MELVLDEFGGEGGRGFRRYREYVEKGAPKEVENPLKKVIASTFLGGEEFIESIKLKYLEEKEIDGRDLPALKEILKGPSLEAIEKAVNKIVERGYPLSKKICIYLSYQEIRQRGQAATFNGGWRKIGRGRNVEAVED